MAAAVKTSPAPSLDDRIADAFEAVMTSEALKALMTEVDQANATARAESTAASAKAIDPKVRPAEVAEARRLMEDANFRSSRMDAAADQLKGLHSKALAKEAGQRRAAEYASAKAERDDLIRDLAEYAAHATAIIALLKRISESNARLQRVNPGCSGETWLSSAEMIARGALQEFSINFDQSLPSLVEGVRLPNFRRDGAYGYAWPPASAY